MSLITQTQRTNAQEPEPVQPKLKAPARPPIQQPEDNTISTVGYNENFVGGTGALAPTAPPAPETEFEPEFNAAFTEPPPAEEEAFVNPAIEGLFDRPVLPGTGFKSSVAPTAPEAVAPALNLWKDSIDDYNSPTLYDGRTLSTAQPTLYRESLSGGSGALAANQAFNSAAGRYSQNARQQQQDQVARAADLRAATRNEPTTRNTPDVEKPWHEAAWQGITGVGKDFLFGTTEAQKAAESNSSFNPVFLGTYGKHGAGIGGALKYALSTPLGLFNEAQYQGARVGKEITIGLNDRFNANAPTKVKSPDGSRYLKWGELSYEQKEKFAQTADNKFRSVFKAPGVNFAGDRSSGLSGFTSVLTGQRVADDLNDANPDLPGVVINKVSRAEPDKVQRAGRTDAQLLASGEFERAKAFAIKGRFFSQGRRPGESWTKDPAGTTYEVINQLFNPGNKVDVVGNAIGGAVATVGGSALRRAFGIKRAATVGGNAAEESLSTLGKPTYIQALPITSVRAGVVSKPQPLVSEAILPGLSKEQLENTPQLFPKTQVPGVVRAPAKATPTEVAEVIGIGQKGQVVEFGLQTAPTSHTDLVAFLKTGNEGQRKLVSGYTGKSWAEWEKFAKKNGLTNPRDINSIASSRPPSQAANSFAELLRNNSANPANVASVFKGFSTDDLIRAANELAANRSVLDANLEALEKVFDTTLDVGRRAVDRVPLVEVTPDTLYKALGDGAPIRLPQEVLSLLPPNVGSALVSNDQDAIAKLIADGDLDDEALAYLADSINQSIKRPFQEITTYSQLPSGIPNPRFPVVAEVVEPPKLAYEVITTPPATVYHGTALADWTPDYNVKAFGSRGELATGMYTTVSKQEATSYAKAVVGENVSPEVAYKELSPQVVALDTSGFKATLDASVGLGKNKKLVRAIIDELPEGAFREQVAVTFAQARKLPSFSEVVAKVERIAATAFDSSEEGLQAANAALSNAARKLGYDSIYDSKSGWFVSLDNAKIKLVTSEAVEAPTTALDAAVARYNVDSEAAGKFPNHITSDANLRDSAYKVLDQVRVETDEAFEAVQTEAIRRISQEEVVPVVASEALPKSETLVAEVSKLVDEPVEQVPTIGKGGFAKTTPATKKAKAAKAVNEIKVAEAKGAPTEVVQQAKEVVAKSLPVQVKLTKTIDDMSPSQLKKLAADMGVDISHYDRLAGENLDLVKSLLQRAHDNPANFGTFVAKARNFGGSFSDAELLEASAKAKGIDPGELGRLFDLDKPVSLIQARRYVEAFQPTPVNPHSTLREAFENLPSSKCDF